MFIDVPGAKLFTWQGGARDARAILAIGGWIGSSELWQLPLAALSDRYRTVAYDHRGSGLTICDPASITLDALVADAIAVLDTLGIQRATIAAESAGAQTAVRLAARHPERVSSLIIVDGMYRRGVAADADPFLQGLQSNYGATIERFVQLCIVEPDSEHIKAWGRKILARAEPQAAIALRVLGSNAEVMNDIPRIEQPTLIVHGEADRIVPLEQGQALSGMIAGAELRVLPGAGHVPTLTRPDEVVAAMRSFLAKLDARA